MAPEEAAYDGVRVLLAVDAASTYSRSLVDGDVEPRDAPDGVRWEGLREVGAAARRPRRRAARDGRGARATGTRRTRAARAAARPPRRRRPAGRAPARTTRPSTSRVATRPSSSWSRDDEDRALLGRRAEWADGLFSTLAGFVEAGESAEMAVLREMAEEAGVLVDAARLPRLAAVAVPVEPHARLPRAPRRRAPRGASRRRRDHRGALVHPRGDARGLRGRHACASRRRSRSPAAWSSTGTAPSSPAPGPARSRTTAARTRRGVRRTGRAVVRSCGACSLSPSGALGEAEAVARRVAEAAVDAVGLLGRLLGELDAARRHLLVGLHAVVGGEEQSPGEALRHEVRDLARVVPRRSPAGRGSP